MDRRKFFLLGLAGLIPIKVETKAPELSLAHVIDTLTEYEVKYVSQLTVNGERYLGMIDYNNKVILVSIEQDRAFRRNTLLHEFLHHYYHSKGGEMPNEEEIGKQSKKIYQKLFKNGL